MQKAPISQALIQKIEQSLAHHDIRIESVQGTWISIRNGYQIEIEHEQLFKLLQDRQVIAPFDDLAEMSAFLENCLILDEQN